jgi:hypothetical protein
LYSADGNTLWILVYKVKKANPVKALRIPGG